MSKDEKPPVSDFYTLIDHVTIFKSDKWWEAVAVIESFGRRSIALYLWQFRDGKWKRKHKFELRNLQEWEQVKKAVEALTPKMQR